MTLPQDASIAETRAQMDRLEKTLVGDKDIVRWSSYVGRGAVRFYLPLDEHGNGRADWAQAQVTTRVDKRARLKVPADLARFLSDRDQVEIL